MEEIIFTRRPCNHPRISCDASLEMANTSGVLIVFPCMYEAGHTVHTPTHIYRTEPGKALKSVTIMWSDDG